MRHENVFLWKVILGGAAAIIVAGLLFFNFDNIVTWMTLNDPSQNQWTVVQLSDGEILYGHLSGASGSVIGLRDVYSLDKVAPAQVTPAAGDATTSSTATSSTTLVLGQAPEASAPQPTLVPVSVATQLFINRTAVLYFKFVAANDPALPYLH